MSLLQRLYAALDRWSLRRSQYSGGAQVIEALYGKTDPWNLGGSEEQTRFTATNAMIRKHCPQVGSLLEIGCGEGHQTQHFLGLTDILTGIDVSMTALLRARDAAPGATYLEGDISDLLPSLPVARYDVATLCEVLYYMDDPASTIDHAQGRADHVIVTIYAPQARRLAALFRGEGWQTLPPILSGRRRWEAYLWSRNPQLA